MNTVTALDKEITQSLALLNIKQKKVVLKMVKTFIGTKKDWWDKFSKEQQQAIDKALAEIKAGKLIKVDKSLDEKYKRKILFSKKNSKSQ